MPAGKIQKPLVSWPPPNCDWQPLLCRSALSPSDRVRAGKDQRACSFPTRFLIKAIGITDYNIRAVLLSVLESHQTEYAVDSIAELDSKHSKYASVTVSINARSHKQLDDIYDGLHARPEIVMTI